MGKNIAIEKRFLGGLDTDTNLQGVSSVDYIDAYNCQNIDKVSNNQNYDIFPLGGNEYKFFLPNVELQKKTIRVLIKNGYDPSSLPPGSICDISFYTQNKLLVGTVSLTTVNSPNISAMASEIVSQSLLFPVSFDVTATAYYITNDVYYGYIDITINQYFSFGIVEDYRMSISGNVVYEYYTLKEAIPLGISGELSVIGRYNVGNDLFIWATTVRDIVFDDISVISVTNIPVTSENANVEIETITPHGLSTGDEIIIENGVYIGHWFVVVISEYIINLVNSAYIPFSSAILSIKKYVCGYGQILYANRGKDFKWYGVGTNVNSATRLIGARGLNFSTLHQIDGLAKVNNFQVKLKFTDNLNPYKMMIYKGQFVLDGFLYNPITGAGGYTYDNIGVKSNLVIGDTSLRVSDVSEVVGGGSLSTYNYVYYARLVNEDFTKTPFSPPSNPISLILNDTSDISPTNIFNYNGEWHSQATNKALQITVDGIPAGVYRFLEIASIEYLDGSVKGYLLERIELNLSQTSAVYVHKSQSYGQPLDLSTINQLYLQINKGLNIVDMDNRTVLSNVTIGGDPNLTEWAKQIQTSVGIHNLPKKQTLSGANPLEFGEYEIPENIFKYTGYHLEDTIRLGVRVKMKGGQWTKVYHISDVNIKSNLLSAGYSMTNGANALSYYIEATNINYDYIVNGVILRDIIDDLEFVRCDINSEVIASGLLFISKWDNSSMKYKPLYDGISFPPSFNNNRRIGFFYSPDLQMLTSPLIEFKQGDKLINLGQSGLESTFSTPNSGDIAEFNGELSNDYSEHNILDVYNYLGQDRVMFPVATSFPLYPAIDILLRDITEVSSLPWYSCYAMYLDTDVNNVTSNSDLGVYNVIWKRPQAQPYPLSVSSSMYISIGGVSIDVYNDTVATVYNIFGGDTFTQKRYLKTRVYSPPLETTKGLAVGFYTQSKQNGQLAKYIFPKYNATSNPLTPLFSAIYYLNILEPDAAITKYTMTWNIENMINLLPSYNSFITELSSVIATCYWSLQSLEDSEQNNDRYFLPLNHRALDVTAGAINHMVKANDILYTFQELRTERQYFDNTQMLQSVTGTEVMLGTGQVMSLKGEFKSIYGCQNKWSVQLGTTLGGRQYIWYVDAVNRKVVRIGDDGTTVISDRKKISTWAFKGLKFAGNQNTPADNYGVHSGWDEKNSHLYITSRTHREVDGVWSLNGSYVVGNLVTNGLTYGLNDAPIIYEAIQDSVGDVDNAPGVGSLWDSYWKVLEYNLENYNFWTLVWSEDEDKFKWFISPRPKIWIPYKETILSPSPIDESNIFEHTELGSEAHWYCRDMGYSLVGVTEGNLLTVNADNFRILEDGGYRLLEDGVSFRLLSGGGTSGIPDMSVWGETIWYLVDSNGVQYEIISVSGGVITVVGELPPDATEFSIVTCVYKQPYIENVVNENKGDKVRFVATKYNSAVAPILVEYATNQHKSFIKESQFEVLDEYYSSSVKPDTTNSPTDNETDASELFGKYLRIKTYLSVNNKQRINNFVMKIRLMNPLINK